MHTSLKSIVYISGLILLLAAASYAQTVFIRPETKLSGKLIKNYESRIKTEISNMKKYEIVDTLGTSQMSDNEKIKEMAYKALSTIAKDKRHSVDLRRSAALQAMNAKNGSPDTMEMLEYAKSNGLIDNDKYYGILAEFFNEAISDEEKIKIINALSASKNSYGNHILLTQNQDPFIIEQMSIPVLKKYHEYMQNNQPVLMAKNSSINIIDYHAMQGWLRSYGYINARIKNQNPSDAMLEYVLNEETDPKYAVAYVLTDEFKRNNLSRAAMNDMQARVGGRLQQLRKLSEKDGAQEHMFFNQAMDVLHSRQ